MSHARNRSYEREREETHATKSAGLCTLLLLKAISRSTPGLDNSSNSSSGNGGGGGGSSLRQAKLP